MHRLKQPPFGLMLLVPVCVLLLTTCNKLKKISPVARFTYTQNCNGQTPCTITFTNLSENAESYKWSFGDGQSSVAKDPVHTYSSGTYYIVKLWAVGKEDETVLTDTVYLIARPTCDTRGTFTCAKKITAGSSASDFITTSQLTNYYYFTVDKPGPVQFELKPVPAGGDIRISLLGEPNANSTELAYGTGHAGEKISFYAGPLTTGEYYLKVRQSYAQAQSDPYILTWYPVTTDPWEVNDLFSQATPITPGQAVQGTILAKGDVDYYTYNQSKDGVMNIVVTPVPAFANYNRLYVDAYYSATSTALIKEVSGLPGETISYAIGPRSAGRYYIKVYGGSGAESITPYSLTVSYDTTDKYEINNTFSTATPAVLGTPLKASIRAAGDADYYSFTAAKSGPVTITITTVPDGLGYMYMELYNAASSTALVLSSSALSGRMLTATSTFNLTINQKYYVKLYASASGESNQQYELKVQQ